MSDRAEFMGLYAKVQELSKLIEEKSKSSFVRKNKNTFVLNITDLLKLEYTLKGRLEVAYQTDPKSNLSSSIISMRLHHGCVALELILYLLFSYVVTEDRAFLNSVDDANKLAASIKENL